MGNIYVIIVINLFLKFNIFFSYQCRQQIIGELVRPVCGFVIHRNHSILMSHYSYTLQVSLYTICAYQ